MIPKKGWRSKTGGSVGSNSESDRTDLTRFEALATTPWIEALLSVAVGLVLLVMRKTDLAQLTWVLGVALSFTRYAFTKKLEEEMAPIHRLASVMDLQRKVPISEFQEMFRVYLEITESEFKQVKDTIITEAIEKLVTLAHQKTSGELATGDYYNWLLPILESTPSGSHIWAVSMMYDAEWDDSPAEEAFLRLNLDAARRGTFLERIFVVKRSSISELSSNKAIMAQVNTTGEFLKPLLVEREYLENRDPQLLKQLGDGMIGFDSRVALIDVFSPEGVVRGYVTMNQAEITRLRRMFDNLRVYSRSMRDSLSATLVRQKELPSPKGHDPKPSISKST